MPRRAAKKIKLQSGGFLPAVRSAAAKTFAPLRGAKLPPQVRRLPVAKNLTFGAVAVLIFLLLLALGLFVFGNKLVEAWQQRTAAAVVNGQIVPKSDLTRRLIQSYGEDTTQQIVDETLIFQEAKKENVQITSEEINAKISDLEKQIPGGLDAALKDRKMDRNDLDRLIRLQIIKEKILGRGLDIKESDITDYFDKNKDTLAQTVNKKPEEITLEEVRSFIVSSLRNSQIQAKLGPWIEDLRAKANIKTFVNP